MKAIILAAGMGKRLFPLSENKPKCLFEVKGRTIIEHQVEKLYSCGITDITIVVGFEFQQIKDTVSDKVAYVFSPFFRTTNSIVSLWLARHTMTDDLIILNADVFFSEDILRGLINDTKKDISMVVDTTSDLSDSDFKLLIEDGLIVDMGKTLTNASGEYVGITKIPKEALQPFIDTMDEMIQNEKLTVWYEMILHHMVTRIHIQHKVFPFEASTGCWFEVDTIEDLLARRNGKQKTEKSV